MVPFTKATSARCTLPSALVNPVAASRYGASASLLPTPTQRPCAFLAPVLSFGFFVFFDQLTIVAAPRRIHSLSSRIRAVGPQGCTSIFIMGTPSNASAHRMHPAEEEVINPPTSLCKRVGTQEYSASLVSCCPLVDLHRQCY